jgi:hypothetical protein
LFVVGLGNVRFRSDSGPSMWEPCVRFTGGRQVSGHKTRSGYPCLYSSQIKMPGLGWSYLSDSGLFNGLQRFQTIKFFAGHLLVPRVPRARRVEHRPPANMAQFLILSKRTDELSVFQVPAAAGDLFAQGRRREWCRYARRPVPRGCVFAAGAGGRAAAKAAGSGEEPRALKPQAAIRCAGARSTLAVRGR